MNRRFQAEALEPRRLLSISVSGTVVSVSHEPGGVEARHAFGARDATWHSSGHQVAAGESGFRKVDTSGIILRNSTGSSGIDISAYTVFAVNPYTPGMTTLTNVYIPPNTNPKFTGGETINGVLHIEAPNTVTFRGNAVINGVIVTDPNAAYDMTNNEVNFAGTVSATPLSSLPPSNPAYDPSLVQLTGSFLLAPAYSVSFTSNFGTIAGNIAAGQLSLTGNATGTLAHGTITTNSLSVTSTGGVYLLDSTVKVSYSGASPLSALDTLLSTGFLAAASLPSNMSLAPVDDGSSVTISRRLIGDINGDGVVNFADFAVLAVNFGATGVDWSHGDLNFDGRVDFADFEALAKNYGEALPT